MRESRKEDILAIIGIGTFFLGMCALILTIWFVFNYPQNPETPKTPEETKLEMYEGCVANGYSQSEICYRIVYASSTPQGQ